MIVESLPKNANELMRWTWPEIEPFYQVLAGRPLDANSLEEWLADWSRVSERVDELYNRLYVATTANTADQESEKLYNTFLDTTYPAAQQAENQLKEKLLQSGLSTPGFEIPLRNMKTEAALFREANLPLLSEDQKLMGEYMKISGAQTVAWEGKEVTLTQLTPVMLTSDRSVRERAWRASMERTLADRDAINALWKKMVTLRTQVASQAGFAGYRPYRWQQLLRFDYTPADTHQFHQAIEDVVVPAARRLLERRRQKLGLDRLRPWDLDVDPLGRPPLHPFDSIGVLVEKESNIFHRVDPQLGDYFEVMVREGLLDLENRKNKAPGAYCALFAAVRLPFIFSNSVGLHADVQALLHESGHAFHQFEMADLPYYPQLNAPIEFQEVASMGMELLAAPYLSAADGGFYTEAATSRARANHLEEILLLWPYIAMVDAFQQWAYENPDQALDPVACDARWASLAERFQPGVDWSGLEDIRATGWQRKHHIFTAPLYYVEYGIAQLGAVQVWRNSLEDQAGSVAAYRQALSLGNTVALPVLFEAAGAKLALDTATMEEAVQLIESTLSELGE